MTTIYTGRCVECARELHREETPFVDGELVPHGCHSYESLGYTVGHACDGRVVSVMGRTDAETYAAIDRIRATSVAREPPVRENPRECPACQGDGRITGDPFPCGPECCGYEHTTCEACRGTGQVEGRAAEAQETT